MVQEGLNSGVLVTWTKSFACTDGVGLDAVKMLEDSLAERGVSMTISIKQCSISFFCQSYLGWAYIFVVRSV